MAFLTLKYNIYAGLWHYDKWKVSREHRYKRKMEYVG